MLLSTLTAIVLAPLALCAPLARRELGTYRIVWRAGRVDDIPGRRVAWLGDVGTHVPGYVYGAHENGNVLGMYASLENQGDNIRRIRFNWELDPSASGPIKSKINRGTDTTGKHCLDATENPGNGVVPHMWDCLDVPQQQWRVRADGLVELDGRGLCLDYRDGAPRPADLRGDEQATIQLWACDAGNTNQQWDVEWTGPYSEY